MRLMRDRKKGFNASAYAACRPTYSEVFYSSLLDYHHGPRNSLIDLGCGHGAIARNLANKFDRVVCLDPSDTMIAQAKSQSSEYKNVEFYVSSAEELKGVKDNSVDVVVAGEAAHWFSYPAAWKEIHRTLRSGGTMAFWGYVDSVLVGHCKATKTILNWLYGDGDDKLGHYWQQPGRTIVQDLFRALEPPTDLFSDLVRREYIPEDSPKPSIEREAVAEKEPMIARELKLGEIMAYHRTSSSYHHWAAAHPDRKPRIKGGEGDVIDDAFDEVLKSEPEWKKDPDWLDIKVKTEWASMIVMARKN